jgi:hypothetical protein
MEDGYSSVLGRMCSVAAIDVLLTANKFQQPVKRFLLSSSFWQKFTVYYRRAGGTATKRSITQRLRHKT